MFTRLDSTRGVKTPRHFDELFANLARELLLQKPFDRGEVHAQKTTTPEMVTHELSNVSMAIEVPVEQMVWASMVKANLPWAEDHFQERVSGEPLNPAPSHEWWPFNRNKNAEHTKEGVFSHTYPERFWPKMANTGGTMADSQRISAVPHVGIRFEYGDLDDLLEVLKKNPRSRQAYLPVWFPEDLKAARLGERVPCTLGYHFLLTPNGELDVTYHMRSCDLVRFWRDDVYMAGRLLQWVSDGVGLCPGVLRLHIASLHGFVGDEPFLRQQIDRIDDEEQYGAWA